MKEILVKLFSPVLNIFDKGEIDENFSYSPSHRKILGVMGVLFIVIASVALYFAMLTSQLAGLLPVVLFGGVGLLCLIVAGLGTDRAVSKIWRNRD